VRRARRFPLREVPPGLYKRIDPVFASIWKGIPPGHRKTVFWAFRAGLPEDALSSNPYNSSESDDLKEYTLNKKRFLYIL
jgi:hypothetical protein